jgi:PAS domain S-box-containing protein
MSEGHHRFREVQMTTKTKSHLMEENATLRARLAELEDRVAERPSANGGRLSESGIAERKRIREALTVSEIRYRRLFEMAKDGILILDADTGQITDANPFLQELLGYSHAELLGKRLWEIGPFRDIAASQVAFRKLQSKKYIRYDNLPLETKGHQHRHVEFVSNVYNVNGTKVIQCNIRDITLRRHAEVGLENANKKLEGLLNALPLGVAFSDDPACERIIGNPTFLSQFEANSGDNLSASAPESNALGHKVRHFREGKVVSVSELPMQRALAERRNIGPKEFEIELPSGRRWIAEVSATPIRNQQRKVVGIVAVTNDITQRKRLQDALKISEVRYRRVFETAKDGILILEADTGRITDANPFLQELLGYSHAELLGKRLWEIGPFRDIKASRGAFRRLQRKEYIRYDNLPLETKGRQRRYVEFVSNVYQENGTKVIQCNIRDITPRHNEEEALANASKELERRVDERTAELLTANRLMKKMLDEGKRAEERISKSRERLRNLSGRLQSLLEEERTRISREIHDELGQALTAMKMDLSLIRRRLVSEGLAEQSAKIHEIELSAAGIIRTVRKIATDLRPGILDELGVVAAIKWMAKNFQNRSGISCKVAVRGVDKVSDPVFATSIFRIVQEATTNVMRHAAASKVDVSLEKKDGTLLLEVRDNGIGIKEERIFDSKSLGLTGIRERVLLLGGEATISGKPGEGTVVSVTLPFAEGAISNA